MTAAPDGNLADRLSVQDVMARYAAGVDERDFDLYASVFADDVAVIGFGPEPIRGRGAWVEHVRQALERYDATQHLLGPVQATHSLAGRDDAVLVLWATYRSELRRGADGWRICRHELVRRAMREL